MKNPAIFEMFNRADERAEVLATCSQLWRGMPDLATKCIRELSPQGMTGAAEACVVGLAVAFLLLVAYVFWRQRGQRFGSSLVRVSRQIYTALPLAIAVLFLLVAIDVVFL